MSGRRTLQSKEPREHECEKHRACLREVRLGWSTGTGRGIHGASVTAETKKVPQRRTLPGNHGLYPGQENNVTILSETMDHMDSDCPQRLRPHLSSPGPWQGPGRTTVPVSHARAGVLNMVTQASSSAHHVSLPLFPFRPLGTAGPLRSKRMSNAGWDVLERTPSNGISNPQMPADQPPAGAGETPAHGPRSEPPKFRS